MSVCLPASLSFYICLSVSVRCWRVLVWTAVTEDFYYRTWATATALQSSRAWSIGQIGASAQYGELLLVVAMCHQRVWLIVLVKVLDVWSLTD